LAAAHAVLAADPHFAGNFALVRLGDSLDLAAGRCVWHVHVTNRRAYLQLCWSRVLALAAAALPTGAGAKRGLDDAGSFDAANQRMGRRARARGLPTIAGAIPPLPVFEVRHNICKEVRRFAQAHEFPSLWPLGNTA